MKAIKAMLAGGIGLAAVAAASPASAQYYPGYGGGNVIGQVLGQILNPGYGGGYGGYGMNSRVMVDRCAAAVTDRVNRQFGGYAYGGGYGGYNQYGYNAPGGARVVAITSVERRSGSRLRVRGVAQAAAYGGGYGYNNVPQELAFKCNVDYRGYVTDIDLDRINSRYGYGYNNPYQPYGTYRRY
jgi:hypothetical protein